MIIGITGKIGSGKSTVAGMFKDATIIDVDKIGHKVLAGECYKDTVEAFGTGILDEDLTINRKILRDIVFNDTEKLQKLENITHPAILNRVETELRMLNTERQMIIIEGAVIDKIGLLGFADKLIVVICDRQKERLNIHGEEIKKIISLQDTAHLEAKADFIIDNNCSLEETRKQVEEIWKIIMNKNI